MPKEPNAAEQPCNTVPTPHAPIKLPRRQRRSVRRRPGDGNEVKLQHSRDTVSESHLEKAFGDAPKLQLSDDGEAVLNV